MYYLFLNHNYHCSSQITISLSRGQDENPEAEFQELYEIFGKGFDDYEQEDDGEEFIQRLTELTKLGETYLKNKGLTEDEFNTGKAELSNQILGQMWSGMSGTERF